MGNNRLKKVTGNFLFKKANKSYEKRKSDVFSSIEEEKKSNEKTTLEIIENLADNKKEDTYWIWLMYVLDMELKIDKETYDNSYFSGKCTNCKNIFTFTEIEKEQEDVKCEGCGQTYTQNDMLKHDE